jgi:transcriptional regulator with XRE-family HTH domain
MADQLGISRPRIAEYEAGRRIPTVTRLYEMIDALGLDYAIFFPEANRRHR